MLRKLSLLNFRCFSSKYLEFKNPNILLVGPNAAGKTSLLEALYYAGYTCSFRTAHRADLIKLGESQSHVKITLDGTEVSVGFDKSIKKTLLDGKKPEKKSEIFNLYKCAILKQEDIEIITGYPETRRTLLNHTAFLCDPSSTEDLKILKKILHQRKIALITQKNYEEILKIWTEKLFNIAKKIENHRKKVIERLQKSIDQICTHFLPSAIHPKLKLKSNIELSDQEFGKAWELELRGVLQKEKLTGKNLFGPQLHDLEITLEAGPAKAFGSRGQQKLMVLILRLAQLDITKAVAPQAHCALLIDDFLSEMDPKNIRIACQLINKFGPKNTLIANPSTHVELLKKELIPQEINLITSPDNP